MPHRGQQWHCMKCMALCLSVLQSSQGGMRVDTADFVESIGTQAGKFLTDHGRRALVHAQQQHSGCNAGMLQVIGSQVATSLLRLRGGSRKNNRRLWKRKHKFQCQVYNTEVRDQVVKKKKRIDKFLMNKLSKAVSSKLVVANCSTPSEVALVEFADELNNRISGVQGNTGQLVKQHEHARLVNGKVVNRTTNSMSYSLTEKAWKAADLDYRLIGIPDTAKQHRRASRRCLSRQQRKDKVRFRKMQARFEARADSSLNTIMMPGALWRTEQVEGEGGGSGSGRRGILQSEEPEAKLSQMGGENSGDEILQHVDESM